MARATPITNQRNLYSLKKPILLGCISLQLNEHTLPMYLYFYTHQKPHQYCNPAYAPDLL